MQAAWRRRHPSRALGGSGEGSLTEQTASATGAQMRCGGQPGQGDAKGHNGGGRCLGSYGAGLEGGWLQRRKSSGAGGLTWAAEQGFAVMGVSSPTERRQLPGAPGPGRATRGSLHQGPAPPGLPGRGHSQGCPGPPGGGAPSMAGGSGYSQVSAFPTQQTWSWATPGDAPIFGLSWGWAVGCPGHPDVQPGVRLSLPWGPH